MVLSNHKVIFQYICTIKSRKFPSTIITLLYASLQGKKIVFMMKYDFSFNSYTLLLLKKCIYLAIDTH